jgi:hypothetical protein
VKSSIFNFILLCFVVFNLVSCGKREDRNKIINRTENEEKIVDAVNQKTDDEIPADSLLEQKINCAVKGICDALEAQSADSSIINEILPITSEILKEKTGDLAKLDCNEFRTYMKTMMLQRINGVIKNESQWGQQLREYLNKL